MSRLRMFNQSSVDSLLKRASMFVEELAKPFVGREEEAFVIALAVFTGEHVVLIGEPGTAKSAIARRAAELLNARFFKYLLTKFTEPDELFGPIDINALREGRYVRITRGKLPEAEVAFIDEIFNANSAILNTFLTIMNERVIYDGYNEIKTPLWTMIAATNSVPEEPELMALYDRFLYKHFVKPIGEDKWSQLLEACWRIEMGLYDEVKPVLNMEEVKEINKLIFTVDLNEVKEKLIKLYAMLEDHGIHVTDRRKGKILKAIAASALLNKRFKAIEEDLMVLKITVPNNVDEYDKVYAILLDEIKSVEKRMKELIEIRNNVLELKNIVLNMSRLDENFTRLIEYLRSIEMVKEKVKKIADETTNDTVRAKALEVLNELDEAREIIKRKIGI